MRILYLPEKSIGFLNMSLAEKPSPGRIFLVFHDKPFSSSNRARHASSRTVF
jgi:hypothetical protein